jgi:hypothetical protein
MCIDQIRAIRTMQCLQHKMLCTGHAGNLHAHMQAAPRNLRRRACERPPPVPCPWPPEWGSVPSQRRASSQTVSPAPCLRPTSTNSSQAKAAVACAMRGVEAAANEGQTGICDQWRRDTQSCAPHQDCLVAPGNANTTLKPIALRAGANQPFRPYNSTCSNIPVSASAQCVAQCLKKHKQRRVHPVKSG